MTIEFAHHYCRMALLSLLLFANSESRAAVILDISPGSIADYSMPNEIDPGKHYLFYLHGRIIEVQGIPAISDVFGEYEYEAILRKLDGQGFVVISEQRPKNTDVSEYAQKLSGQVQALIDAGVPPESVTVIGASKGSYIAGAASYALKNSRVNFVLTGSCHSSMVRRWIEQGMTLYGNVLSIYDIADVDLSGSCDELFAYSEGKGLGRHKEIVLEIGTGHGILYKPLDEWILPSVAWARQP